MPAVYVLPVSGVPERGSCHNHWHASTEEHAKSLFLWTYTDIRGFMYAISRYYGMYTMYMSGLPTPRKSNLTGKTWNRWRLWRGGSANENSHNKTDNIKTRPIFSCLDCSVYVLRLFLQGKTAGIGTNLEHGYAHRIMLQNCGKQPMWELGKHCWAIISGFHHGRRYNVTPNKGIRNGSRTLCGRPDARSV